MTHSRLHYVLPVVALLAGQVFAQAGAAHRTSELRSITVTSDDSGPVIELTATGPVTPKLQTVQDPLRLVIDLPNSILATKKRRVPFHNEQIKSIRLNQYQSSPAITRIVVDLAEPVQYTSEVAGNRILVRIRPDKAATAKPPSVPAFTAGVQPAATPVAVGNSGTLIETGSRVASGSSITAGEEIAVLRLARGGEVRVCPGTTVSVATSLNGGELMLGMSNGAMETHYGLQESSDSVLTPDFRIVLPGPGEFNLAISADAKGNTCVGSMPGTTSSAVVAELLGSGTYEIKPEQQVVFRQGRLDSVEAPIASCGCPTAPQPVLRTSVDPSQVIPEDQAPSKMQLENSPTASAAPPAPAAASRGSVQNPTPDNKRAAMESPLVFSGTEAARARQAAQKPAAKVPAAPTVEAAKLPLVTQAHDPLPAIVVLPPPEPKRKGFFGKVKGFFGAIFH